MKKKNYILIFTISILFLSFISHFIYDTFHVFLTGLFFPVNESIFEHMKMLYTTYFIFFICFYNINNFKNLFTNFYLSIIFQIVLFLAIYIPIYLIFGEIMIFTITWLFISIFITSLFSFKIFTSNIKQNKLFIILTVITFIVNIYLTYYPPHNFIFVDKTNNTYGLYK